jgi:ketopantoate reductase
VLWGPHAAALAAALERGGIAAVAADATAFAAAEAEKMGFNCVVGLPLAVHRGSLGEYLEREEGEARTVFEEALVVVSRALSVAPRPRAWEEFVRACEPIGWVRAATAKALEYRNGAIVRLARELGTSAPANQRLLEAAGFRG